MDRLMREYAKTQHRPWVRDLDAFDGGDRQSYVGRIDDFLVALGVAEGHRTAMLKHVTSTGDWVFEESIRMLPSLMLNRWMLDFDSRYVGRLAFCDFPYPVHTIFLKAAQGCGKTTSVAGLIRDNRSTYRNVLFVTSRVCVASQQVAALTKHGIIPRFYQDEAKYEEGTVAICQMESLPRYLMQVSELEVDEHSTLEDIIERAAQLRVCIPRIDLVVLDEAESCLMHLFSSTVLRNKARLIQDVFIRLLRSSRKLIMMDADMSDATLDFVVPIRCNNPTPTPEELSPFVFKWFVRTPPKKHIINVTHRPRMESLMYQAFLDGRKFVVGCDSLRLAKSIHQLLLSGAPDDGDRRVKLYTSETPTEDKMALHNCNTDWQQYQVVIHSPTITYGLDFNEAHFNVQFYMFTMRSVPPSVAFQMVGRVRQTSSMRVFVHFVNRRNNHKTEEEMTHIKDGAPVLQRITRDVMAASMRNDISRKPHIFEYSGMSHGFYFRHTEKDEVDQRVDELHTPIFRPLIRLYATYMCRTYGGPLRFPFDFYTSATVADFEWETDYSKDLSADGFEAILDDLGDVAMDDLSQLMLEEPITHERYHELSRKRKRNLQESVEVHKHEILRVVGWAADADCTADDLKCLGLVSRSVEHLSNFYAMIDTPFVSVARTIKDSKLLEVEDSGSMQVKMLRSLLCAMGVTNPYTDIDLEPLVMRGPQSCRKPAQIHLTDAFVAELECFVAGDCGFPSAKVVFNQPNMDAPRTLGSLRTFLDRLSRRLLRIRSTVRVKRYSCVLSFGHTRLLKYLESAYAKHKNYGDGPDSGALEREMELARSVNPGWEFVFTPKTGVAAPW